MTDYTETTIVLVSGGFDPAHSGHISYFSAAKQLGDILIAGINSDAWLERKKGRAFMPFDERRAIVGSIKSVDLTLYFDDDDGSAIDLINQVKAAYPNTKIIFANGGDRTASNTPEQEMFKDDPQVEFRFGIGGDDKLNSSSWILEDWKAPKTIRPWGYYRVLHEDNGVKVKELTINPGSELSMQRHTSRSEFWLVADNECVVYFEDGLKVLNRHTSTHIATNQWHQLKNPYSTPCKIIEIQYGTICTEADIERK